MIYSNIHLYVHIYVYIAFYKRGLVISVGIVPR